MTQISGSALYRNLIQNLIRTVPGIGSFSWQSDTLLFFEGLMKTFFFKFSMRALLFTNFTILIFTLSTLTQHHSFFYNFVCIVMYVLWNSDTIRALLFGCTFYSNSSRSSKSTVPVLINTEVATHNATDSHFYRRYKFAPAGARNWSTHAHNLSMIRNFPVLRQRQVLRLSSDKSSINNFSPAPI